jgi:hypothetical protein
VEGKFVEVHIHDPAKLTPMVAEDGLFPALELTGKYNMWEQRTNIYSGERQKPG